MEERELWYARMLDRYHEIYALERELIAQKADDAETRPINLDRALQNKGFISIRQKGSHAIFQHPDGRITVIPMHSGDMPLGTLKAILDDIELTVEDLQ